MEQNEIALIEQHADTDVQLKSLWEQHKEFGKQLDAMEAKSSLTDVEETEMKELKKKKLANKTLLQKALDSYRTEG